MDPRAQKVINLFEGGLHQELSLSAVARAVNLSPSRLRHLFKAETGYTPTQYLQEMRMRKAKDLLEGTFLRVKEVAYTVGMRNESYFVRTFKKTYGRPPAKYREGHFLLEADGSANRTARMCNK